MLAEDGILGACESVSDGQIEWRKAEEADGSQFQTLTAAMTRMEMAPEVFDDFDRFFATIAQFDVGSAPERMGKILEAVQILASSPMLGRPVKGGKRELIIGRASRGYVALYRYVAALDTVFVLAVRSQRESALQKSELNLRAKAGTGLLLAKRHQLTSAHFVGRAKPPQRRTRRSAEGWPNSLPVKSRL